MRDGNGAGREVDARAAERTLRPFKVAAFRPWQRRVPQKAARVELAGAARERRRWKKGAESSPADVDKCGTHSETSRKTAANKRRHRRPSCNL